MVRISFEEARAPLGPLVVGEDARWLELPSGGRVELPRQRALRRILLALVHARIEHPGLGIPGDRLLAYGWPGEIVAHEAGAIRVRVAMSRLRSLGLRELIASRDDGYLLRADARVVLATAGGSDPSRSNDAA
jgi:hypothetical protein